MNKGKLVVLVVVAALIAAFFIFDLKQYLSLDYVKSQQENFAAFVRDNALLTAGAYFAIYVAVTGLSLPGAAVLTLVGGAIFGLLWGTIIVSFASSIGATLAFLASRFLLRDWVQAKFGKFLKPINEGVEKEGAFYLFALRLVPAFPFFAINLAMGLTPIKTRTFYWVSQVGMFAGTVAYVYAGTQLARISSLRDILSPGLISAFVVLGLFPVAAKKVLDVFKARKVYAKWTRPAKFDRNVVAIGAGSAGLVTAYIAAAVKAKVTLIERHKMGGDCLNTGCVPSKALIRSAKLLSHIRRSKEFGIRAATADFDFAEVMERVQRVVNQVEPHDSVERYAKLGVECLKGTAKITSPWSVDVALENGTKRTITTKNIVIAAGGRPSIPPIPGLKEAKPLTSDTIWEIRKLPKRLVVLGGGPIGCELTQCFARLGSQVTQIEMLPRIMIKEDPEFSELVTKRFRAEGVDVLVEHKAKEVRSEGGEKIVIVEHEGREKRIACDEILCAVGRVANTDGYGLEELGIPVTKQKTVEVNEYLQAHYPNIYACGDVAGPYQFTHTASHMAWYCAVNALFGRFRKFRVDYSVIPWATFTDPEVARVGLNETEAKEKKIAYEVSTYGIDDLDRAIADGEAEGYVKVLTQPGGDKILGVTIAGEHAGDILAEFVAAMRHGFGMEKILATIHIYPTLAEANKYAAGVWKRKHVTQGQMSFLAAFNDWTRGDAGFGGALAKVWALVFDKSPYHQTAESHGDD
jgi:dihydrolipoamide dehydrogenase